jgi:hypothetical protein
MLGITVSGDRGGDGLELNPDTAGDGETELNVAGGGGEGESVVVVTLENGELGTGLDGEGVEEFEEFSVALVDAANLDELTGRDFVEGEPAGLTAEGGGIEFGVGAVRAGFAGTEFAGEEFFEVLGNGMFEALGFLVDLEPLHTEDFDKHPLNEVVAIEDAIGNLATFGGELDVPAGGNVEIAVALEAANSHGNGGWGDMEPAGDGSGDDGLTLRFRLGDGFKVVLLGDGDFGCASHR